MYPADSTTHDGHLIPSTSHLSEDCLVCGESSHGIHFGVLSCRACAAFFRRTIVLDRKYACRRNSLNCRIEKDEHFLCRLCRFNKCLRLGMTTENVQLNRDRLKSTVSKNTKNVNVIVKMENDDAPDGPVESVIKSLETTRGMNNTEQSNLIQMKKSIDLSSLSRSIRIIFTIFTPTFAHRMPLTALQRMMVGLGHLRRNQNRNPEMIKSFNLLLMGRAWKEHFELVAEYLQYCEEFESLEMKEKMTILRSSWFIFHRLERIAISFEIFGDKVITEKKLVIFNNYAFSKETKFDPTNVSDYGDEYFKGLFGPSVEKFLVEVAKPLRDLNLTEFELVYMLNQLVWHLEGKGVSDSTLRVADAYRERISNELHDYYIHERKTPNYANRLFRMMELIQMIEQLQYERGQLMNLIKIFDVFKFEIPDSELIDYRRC